jgi:3-hydroxyacyl-CoA dehydrogenase / 3-hydroxy-2-methylbutyryl-CoA dehydrogenase
VAILDRSEPSEALLKSSRVKYFAVDIREVYQISDAVEGTVKWTKETGAALGGVVNCAGVGTAAKIIDAHGMLSMLGLSSEKAKTQDGIS